MLTDGEAPLERFCRAVGFGLGSRESSARSSQGSQIAGPHPRPPSDLSISAIDLDKPPVCPGVVHDVPVRPLSAPVCLFHRNGEEGNISGRVKATVRDKGAASWASAAFWPTTIPRFGIVRRPVVC